jgi:universal protein Kae1
MELISLGIESTAHTFGVGIVTEEGRILANESDMHVPKKGAGIIPREAAEHHTQLASSLIKRALEKAKLNLKDIGIISVALGPGLPPCLNTGATISRYLSLITRKPLIPVNHSIAHIEIGKLTTGAKDPVVVYLSGGNTQIIAYASGKYRIFGETEDIPVGNAIDNLARELGLKTPGGPEVERAAAGGKYVDLPYVVKGMDLSFTGITTEAIKKFKHGISVKDICFSFQETVFAMLVEVAERAVAHTGKSELLLVGGVAANKKLQEMFKIMCDERGAKLFCVPAEYAGDNGAMIAWTGILEYKSGNKTGVKESKVRQKWRTDEAQIKWLD